MFHFYSLLQMSLLFLLLSSYQVNSQTLDPSQIRDEILLRLNNLVASTPTADPVVFRLDEIAEELIQRAQDIVDAQDRIDFVVNGLSVTNVWPWVLGGGETNALRLFAQALLGILSHPDALFAQTRQDILDSQTQGRDFTEEIVQSFDAVVNFYNETGLDPAPLYLNTYGYQYGSNAAASFPNGRCFAYFNLGARRMLQPGYFRVAVIHETWHCVQGPISSSAEPQVDLLQLSLHEGVATYLTSLVGADFRESDLLFWSEQELADAKARKTDILLAYEVDRDSTDEAITDQWYLLDKPLSRVAGAPSRCGYYVAWLAMQAYVKQSNISRTDLPKHLLELTGTPAGRELIWQALVEEEMLADVSTSSGFASHVLFISAVAFFGAFLFSL